MASGARLSRCPGSGSFHLQPSGMRSALTLRRSPCKGRRLPHAPPDAPSARLAGSPGGRDAPTDAPHGAAPAARKRAVASAAPLAPPLLPGPYLCDHDYTRRQPLELSYYLVLLSSAPASCLRSRLDLASISPRYRLDLASISPLFSATASCLLLLNKPALMLVDWVLPHCAAARREVAPVAAPDSHPEGPAGPVPSEAPGGPARRSTLGGPAGGPAGRTHWAAAGLDSRPTLRGLDALRTQAPSACLGTRGSPGAAAAPTAARRASVGRCRSSAVGGENAVRPV